MRPMRLLAALPAVTLITSLTACAGGGGIGTMGDVLGSARSNSLYGEVRAVDTRSGRIQIREQGGRDYTVRYDNRTRVVYRQREYSVSNLERGDQVQMHVEYDRNNTPWAERIDVRESTRGDRTRNGGYGGSDRDRDDAWGRSRVERLDGRVQGIDMRRGYFTVTQTRGPRIVVYMPRDARRDDIRQFERLRRGERVRADVRLRGRERAELVRFR